MQPYEIIQVATRNLWQVWCQTSYSLTYTIKNFVWNAETTWNILVTVIDWEDIIDSCVQISPELRKDSYSG